MTRRSRNGGSYALLNDPGQPSPERSAAEGNPSQPSPEPSHVNVIEASSTSHSENPSEMEIEMVDMAQRSENPSRSMDEPRPGVMDPGSVVQIIPPPDGVHVFEIPLEIEEEEEVVRVGGGGAPQRQIAVAPQPDTEEDYEDEYDFDPDSPHARQLRNIINWMRASSICTIAYLVPATAALVVVLIFDWNRPCVAPLKVWAVVLCVVHLLACLFKTLILVRLPSLDSPPHVQEEGLQNIHTCANCSRINSAIWFGWFVIGAFWLLDSMNYKDCEARGLFIVGVLMVGAQVAVVGLVAAWTVGHFLLLLRRVLRLRPWEHPPPLEDAGDFPGRSRKSPGASPGLIENSTALETFRPGLLEPDSSICPICLADYQVGEELRYLPCSDFHHFHKDCVDQWLVISKSCPLCKQDIDKKPKKRKKKPKVHREELAV